MARASRLGTWRRPFQTTTAAPGKAVKPPTTPPDMPTRDEASQPPWTVARTPCGRARD